MNELSPDIMQRIEQAKKMMNGNPQETVEKLAQNNPMANMLLSMSKSGQNLEALFNMACRQKGIDPQAFLEALKK